MIVFSPLMAACVLCRQSSFLAALWEKNNWNIWQLERFMKKRKRKTMRENFSPPFIMTQKGVSTQIMKCRKVWSSTPVGKALNDNIFVSSRCLNILKKVTKYVRIIKKIFVWWSLNKGKIMVKLGRKWYNIHHPTSSFTTSLNVATTKTWSRELISAYFSVSDKWLPLKWLPVISSNNLQDSRRLRKSIQVGPTTRNILITAS